MSTTGPLVLFSIDSAMSGDTLPADGASRTVRIEASHTFGWRTFDFSCLDAYKKGYTNANGHTNPTAVYDYRPDGKCESTDIHWAMSCQLHHECSSALGCSVGR